MAQGSGFRVQGSGFRVQGSGFRVQVAGCNVQGAGFRVQEGKSGSHDADVLDVTRVEARRRELSSVKKNI